MRIGITMVDGIEGRELWQDNKSYQGHNPLEIPDNITCFVSRASMSSLSGWRASAFAMCP